MGTNFEVNLSPFPQMNTQSSFDISQYLELLDLTYQVAQALKGKMSQDSRWPDCQQLAVKLFFHAATVYDLRQGTKAPLKALPGGANFYDFASVAVITRAALDTYLTMFEVFFLPNNEDEFEFNYVLWQLSGFVIREDYVPTDPALESDFANSQQYIQELRNRIQKTAKFASLKPGEQKEILKGKRKGDWKSIAKAAGFGEQFIKRMRAYYSGYVHADGLSGIQVVTAQTSKEQVELIEIHMVTMMMVLAKMIIQYANIFPESKAICDKNPKAYYLAQFLAETMNRIP